MTEIPEDVMRLARDLDRVGCGCDEVEAQVCEHVRECLCDRQANAIARAIMAREAKARNEALEEAAKVADNFHTDGAAILAVSLATRHGIATAIRAMIAAP